MKPPTGWLSRPGLATSHRRYIRLAEPGFVEDGKPGGGGPFIALRVHFPPACLLLLKAIANPRPPQPVPELAAARPVNSRGQVWEPAGTEPSRVFGTGCGHSQPAFRNVFFCTLSPLNSERGVALVVRQQEHGVGVVFLNGFGVWGRCGVRPPESGRWSVRLSLDDFDALGVHEYQRVRLRLPRQAERDVFLRGRRDRPPFVWLEFSADVRR